MKYAMTMDGKIATYSGLSKWITGEKAREHVQNLRHRYKAIMAGIGLSRIHISACSGFLFGLATADAYFKTGRFHKAVVVGAEVLSKIMDWNDRSTGVLFGDGAGAAVVTDEGDALKGFVQGSDGKGGEALDGDNRPVVNPFTDNGKQSALGGYVTMDLSLIHISTQSVICHAIS